MFLRICLILLIWFAVNCAVDYIVASLTGERMLYIGAVPAGLHLSHGALLFILAGSGLLFLVLLAILIALLSKEFRALLKRARDVLWSTLKRSVLPAIVGFVGLVILFSADLLAESVHQFLKAAFFEELGTAFIVSGLIAFMVEFNFHRREQRKAEEERNALANSVFNYLLGSLAPPWLTRKVSDLYKMMLLRENIVVIFNFTTPPEEVDQLYPHPKPDPAELLQVKMEISYTLRNLTEQQIRADIRHNFTPSVPLPASYSRFTDLLVTDRKKPLLKWDEKSGHKGVCCNVSDKDRLGWRERKIEVTENLFIGPQDTMNVTVKLKVMRWRNDHVTWVTRLPADHMTVIIKNECSDIKVVLDPAHPNSFNEIAGGWESTGELLPFQGFSLYWFLNPHEDGLELAARSASASAS